MIKFDQIYSFLTKKKKEKKKIHFNDMMDKNILLIKLLKT